MKISARFDGTMKWVCRVVFCMHEKYLDSLGTACVSPRSRSWQWRRCCEIFLYGAFHKTALSDNGSGWWWFSCLEATLWCNKKKVGGTPAVYPTRCCCCCWDLLCCTGGGRHTARSQRNLDCSTLVKEGWGASRWNAVRIQFMPEWQRFSLGGTMITEIYCPRKNL